MGALRNGFMDVDLIWLRITATSHDASGLRALLDPVPGASSVGVILHAELSNTQLQIIAERLLAPSVRLLAVLGPAAETLHDLLDREKLRASTDSVITVWDASGRLSDFLEALTFTYRGLMDVEDQGRKTVVYYISDRGSIPEELRGAVERMRMTRIRDLREMTSTFLAIDRDTQIEPREAGTASTNGQGCD